MASAKKVLKNLPDRLHVILRNTYCSVY